LSIVYRLYLILALAFAIVGGAVNESRVLAVARTIAGTFCPGSVDIDFGVINDLWEVKHSKPGTLAAVLFVFAAIYGGADQPHDVGGNRLGS
jgi:hypothetical protein